MRQLTMFEGEDDGEGAVARFVARPAELVFRDDLALQLKLLCEKLLCSALIHDCQWHGCRTEDTVLAVGVDPTIRNYLGHYAHRGKLR